METDRCGQTKEESGNITEVIVIPDDPPSPQDIAGPSVSFSSSPVASSSRVADTLQLPSVDLVTRRDSADCHLNRPPQPPVENRRIARRETQTVGESTVNASTSLCRPYNVPARKRKRRVALSYRKQGSKGLKVTSSNITGYCPPQKCTYISYYIMIIQWYSLSLVSW